MNKHLLFQTGDANVPRSVCDEHGEVVLGLCRICNRAESELVEECIPKLSPELEFNEYDMVEFGNAMVMAEAKRAGYSAEFIDVAVSLKLWQIRRAETRKFTRSDMVKFARFADANEQDGAAYPQFWKRWR